MKSKTVVLTAAAGRKLLRRIRTLEDDIAVLYDDLNALRGDVKDLDRERFGPD